MRVCFVGADGSDIALDAQPGRSLMQLAVQASIAGIEAECGGMMTCGTCHVYVRAPHDAQLPAPSAEELGMLDFAAAPVKPCSRLSCQVNLSAELDGLTVDVPDRQY